MEAQKKAAEDSYNAQIKLLEDKKDALQDEIDKIKEANEDREEAIDLQEKQLALAKAENQKTILQYTEDRGFIYTQDGDAIRDAKNELDNAKSDAEIRALEKQQDALDKQIEAINEMLDATNEYWDAQIEQTEKYYDTMIKGMEEYKDRWDELSDLQEHAEMIGLLKELGFTEEDLLNESSGAFDKLRMSYLGILKDLNIGNKGVLDGLSQIANIDMGNVPSFLGEMQGYIDSMTDGVNEVASGFQNIADSAASAASAISGGGGTSGKSDGNNQLGKGASNDTKNGTTGSSLQDAIEKVSTTSVDGIQKIANAFAGDEEEGISVVGAVQQVIDKVGSTDSESGDSENLASALMGQTAQALDEENGIPAQKTAWEELNGSLDETVGSVTTLQSTLEDMDGKQFTVTLNVIGNAATMGIDMLSKFSTSGNGSHGGAGKAHIEGTANAQGNWGTKEGGRTLVGELGQELWVHSGSGTFETVGDNGAEFINTKKGDIIFNHLQTEQLLNKGNITGRGKAYASGTIEYTDGTIVTHDGHKICPIQHGDRAWELQKAFEPLVKRIQSGQEEIINNAMFEGQRQFEKWTREITNNTAINNVVNNRNIQPTIIVDNINITCPGVTSTEVMNNFTAALNREFCGLSNNARQFAMRRK